MSKILIIATLAAMGFGGLAQAQPAAPSEAVDIRGLDAGSPADVQTLYTRISHAAADVCSRLPQDAFANTSDRIENCDMPTIRAAFKTMPASLAMALQGRLRTVQLASN